MKPYMEAFSIYTCDLNLDHIMYWICIQSFTDSFSSKWKDIFVSRWYLEPQGSNVPTMELLLRSVTCFAVPTFLGEVFVPNSLFFYVGHSNSYTGSLIFRINLYLRPRNKLLIRTSFLGWLKYWTISSRQNKQTVQKCVKHSHCTLMSINYLIVLPGLWEWVSICVILFRVFCVCMCLSILFFLLCFGL